MYIHNGRQVYLAGGMEEGCLPVLHAMAPYFLAPYVQPYLQSMDDPSDALFTRFSFSAIAMNLEELPGNQADGVRVYPNPGTDGFSLEWESGSIGNTTVHVHDIHGRTVLVERILTTLGLNRVMIAMNHVAPGLYVGGLRSDETVSSFKWIRR